MPVWNLLTYGIYLSLFEFANENEERQFIPAIQHGHALATGGRFVDHSYPWGYVGNMSPLMYPVMGSDRSRDDLCALNTIPSSEGDLQLKRSLEVNDFIDN